MRITFELEPDDLERFHEAIARVRRTTQCADEVDVIDAAKYALDHLSTAQAPAYVRKRLSEVQRLLAMLEDDAWALPGPERADVLQTLAYFSDPDDLIPDHIEVIGLLDDAIMLELLMRRLRHVSKAYADFCAFRSGLDPALRDDARRHGNARALAEQRHALQNRMRRQQGRARRASERARERATAVV